MVVSKKSYEDLRKQRLEENKKRMEQLNIPQLTQALKIAHSPMKRTKPRAIGTEMVVVRRSSRVASLPAPVYKEHGLNTFERFDLPRSGRKYWYSRKELGNRVYASDEAREYAINKAEELESKLENGHLSFFKPLFHSHVTGGSLYLPGDFCKKYLPENDETVTLIDENGDEFPIVYIARQGLSAGWRRFSVSHKLIDGDALVFHLIKRVVFKVYIIRNKDYYADGEINDGSDA